MRAELRDSLEFLYPDSGVADKACESQSVDVARNGTAATHVLLNGITPGSALTLTARLNGRAAPGAEWFRLVDVPVEQNTGPVGYCEKEEKNPHVTRRAPFRVYDAMEPLAVRAGRATVRAGAETMAFRVHLPMAGGRPGEREYRLDVTHGDETHPLALKVRVHGVTIPPVGRDSVPNTNWFSLAAMAKSHGLEPWSGAHGRMIRRYADLMVRCRQNMFWVPGVMEVKHERPCLNTTLLRRLVRLFTEAGMYFIEGPHLAHFTSGWHGPTFDINFADKVRATTQEGHAVLADVARQLVAEIDRNGWRERWIQHVSDEPSSHNVADYRLLCGMVRRHMPGLPLMDAMDLDPGTAAGSVDLWCPKNTGYQQNRAAFDAARAQGDRVWVYTCCYPGGPWLNRLLDMELLRPCLMGWAAARFHLDGYLHWGLNHYRGNQDPFQASVFVQGDGWVLPAGDTHIVYPGPDGPWSSVRFEAQREGFEDYEMVQLLRRRAPARAESLVGGVIQGFDAYTKQVSVLREARRRLLEATSSRA